MEKECLSCIKIGWQKGVTISTKQARVVLDPVGGRSMGKNTHIFITHAHADHTYGLKTGARKYATAETIKIYEKLRHQRLRNTVPIQMNKCIKIEDITITPINAGHMLGSVQFLVETPERTVLYTGDINCIDTLTTKAAQTVDCDELIMEATYGDPFYVFPSRHRIYARIVEWAAFQARKGKSPVFRVYAAGKAQEIIRIFNVYTTLPVVTNPAVSKVNEAHAIFGVKLDYVESSSRKGSDVSDGIHVFVTTTRDESITSEKSSRAVATGWALKMRSRNFPSFPLSSHADFRQLVNFVRATKAKKVYLYTGYADIFSEYLLKKLELKAKPLPALAQTELGDF
jgi:putative mRNA 3-end processing factor